MAATLPDEPYRSAVETPLEALVRRGPVELAGAGAARRTSLAPLLLVQLVVVLGLLQGWGLMLTICLAGTLLVVPPMFGAVAQQLRWDRAFAELGAELAALPFPVAGFESWRPLHPLGFGPLEVELREPHPLVEAALRSAEPDARVTWPRDHVLWVQFPPSGHAEDLARLRRLLVDVLAAHADELGVAAVRCLPWPEAAPRRGVQL